MHAASTARYDLAARFARGALAHVAFVHWYVYGQSGNGA
jgi:hypothetical protein